MKNTKAFYSICIAILLAVNSYAQTVELVTGNESRSTYQSKNYLVTGVLTLTAGFTFTGTSGTSFYARAHSAAVTPTAPNSDKNFVRTETVSIGSITTEAQVKALPIGSKTTSFVYSDGIGRSTQSNVVAGSPAFNDLVTVFDYNSTGRPSGDYLPYSTNSGAAGSFRSNAKTDQQGFYNSPPSKVKDDSRAHSDITYETSPLGRVTSTKAVGNAWTNKPVTTTLYVNEANTIRMWDIVSGLPKSTSTYPAGALTITEATDEESMVTKTYTDFLGRVVLKEVQAPASQVARTYYVYNLHGQVLFIIPPAAASTLVPDAAFANLWYYQFKYDSRQRLTDSKAPGLEWAITIYDQWDRPVLTQDGNQRAKSPDEWSVTKYDAFNRTVMTATFSSPETRSYHEGQVASSGRYEARNTSAVGYTLDQTYPTLTDTDLLTISYFDNHTFTSNSGWDAEGNSYAFVAESGFTGSEFTTVLDLPTGSKTKVINKGTTHWLNSVTRYDNKYRAIQAISENVFGKIDRTTTEYDYAGKVLKIKRVHNNNLPQTVTIQERFDYDITGRLTRSYHKINNQPEILLSLNEYNELGQIIDTKLHSTDGGASWLQSIDTRYNISGHPTAINTVADGGDPVDYFGYDLAFENSQSGNSARTDGLVSGMRWKHDLSTKARIYNYSYDKRIFTGANYKVDNSANAQTNVFAETGLTYDLNGNIQSLTRKSGLLTESTIDQLGYTYGNSGNELTKVSDGIAGNLGFIDGANTDNDYDYDDNGNLLYDRNKGIYLSGAPAIEYNVLNLPNKINLSTTDYITYTYDAIGEKLSQKFMAGTVEQGRTEYAGEFIYENGSPSVIHHDYGRLVSAANDNLITNITTREANSTTGYTANGSVTLTTYTAGTPLQTYVKAVCNQTGGTPGVYPIGGSIAVTAGDSYTFKVLGYQSVGTNAALYVYGNSNIIWPGTPLKIGAANEDWVTASFTVPSGVTSIQLGVLWSSGTSGHTIYINRVALYKSQWEYQYLLSDHLGSPRVVLQTETPSSIYTATMEHANFSNENERFLNLSQGRELAFGAATGTYAYLMNASNRVGPGRSFKVLPGDVVNANVMAYYASGGSYTKTVAGTMATYVAGAMSGGFAGAIDGVSTTSYGITNNPTYFALSPDMGSSRPSAFINYILFDETYTPLEAKSTAVGATAGVSHQISLPAINVTQTGYLYIYLTYDNSIGQDVYFDDFNIIYQESPVTQINSFYPFGMAAFTWIRSGEYENKFQYQGKEFNSKTGLYDFHARQYDAATGRWLSADPKSQFGSPYLAMGNNPAVYTDPDGEWVQTALGAVFGGISGYRIGKAMNAKGWQLFWYTLGGAAIGALSGGASELASGAGMGAFASGAIGGSINGAGMAGLADQNIFRGGLIGGISGGLGGAFGTAIGGGGGALAAGFASDVSTQFLSTGDVDFGQALGAGAMSFGLYHASTGVSLKVGPGRKLHLTYRQFAVMQADFQRSRFWHKEYGGLLMNDGSVKRFPKAQRYGYMSVMLGSDNVPGIKAMYHTHWGKHGGHYYERRFVYSYSKELGGMDVNYSKRRSWVPSFMKNQRGVFETSFHNTNIHSGDMGGPYNSYVLNPKGAHFGTTTKLFPDGTPTRNQWSIGNPFIRNFNFNWWW